MKLAAGLISISLGNPVQDWAFKVWSEKADEVFEYTRMKTDDFMDAVNSQPQSYFEPTFDFCDANENKQVSKSEFLGCGKRLAESAGFSDPGFRAKTDAIMDKYWYFFDQDRNDSLSWDEWRSANSAFSAIDALVILEGFDADHDGSLNSTELSAWRSKMREMFASFGYEPTPEQHAAMAAAWEQSQIDDDASTASMIELSRFNLLLWNSFVQ